jgi:7-carboxy-7-deazaguanine synthase
LPVVCDLMSISPKLSNSIPSATLDPQWVRRHTVHRHVPKVVHRLTTEYDYQLKFVIDAPDDCREVEQYLRDFPHIDRGRVMLMPQGVDATLLAEKAAWLEPYCSQHGFQFCARRHIDWFGAVRGR